MQAPQRLSTEKAVELSVHTAKARRGPLSHASAVLNRQLFL